MEPRIFIGTDHHFCAQQLALTLHYFQRVERCLQKNNGRNEDYERVLSDTYGIIK
jgi:hypothetical protein